MVRSQGVHLRAKPPAAFFHTRAEPQFFAESVSDAVSWLLLLSPLLRVLDSRQLRLLCDFGKLIRVKDGQAIYRAGDEASAVYLIADGRIEVEEGGISTRLKGEVVGELAILTNRRRTGSARARSRASLVELPAALLWRLLSTGLHAEVDPLFKHQLTTAALRDNGLFHGLGEASLRELAVHSDLRQFARHELLERPANNSESVYILVSGQVSCTERYAQEEIVLGVLCPGSAFRMVGPLTGTALRARSNGWILRVDQSVAHHVAVMCPMHPIGLRY